MAQGDIKALQEDTGTYKEIALAVSTVEIGGNGGGSTEGHRVRFFDPFGELLKTEYVANGQNATAPTPPTLSLLTFAEWNHPRTNITRDEDIGAIYDTTDGKTYIFVHVNALTGLQPTIYLQKSTTDQLTVDWGDSTTNNNSASGNVTIQKTAAYASAGNYTITITCVGEYDLGQGTNATTLFGSYLSNNYTSIVQKVYFGENTTTLNANVFFNYYGIDAITVSSGIIGSINSYAFRQCSSLTFLTLPSGMTGSIGAYTFAYCSSLASLTLPSGMTGSVGTYAFAYCYSLTSLILPSGMTGSIGAYTFRQCYSLASLTLPSGMTGSIGTYAFYLCSSLVSLTLPSGMTGSIETNAFRQCYSLASLTLPSGMTGSIETNTFRQCYSLASLTLPSGMTGSIETYAFYMCSSLASLTLPSGMTGSIGAYTFAYCSSLASLTLPSGMTGSVGAYTFAYCYSLASLTLPSELATDIGDSSLRQITAVRSLTIPSGITSLAINAFEGNSAMDEYIFQSATPPTMADTTVFANIQLWTRIYVPDANVNDYKTATNWTTYADYIYSINDRI